LRESVQYLGVEGYNLPVSLRVSLYTRFTFSEIGDMVNPSINMYQSCIFTTNHSYLDTCSRDSVDNIS